MAAIVLLAAVPAAWGGNVTFKAKLDSATLLMGKTTTLHLEITQDKDARGFFPGEQLDTLNAMVEIAERPDLHRLELRAHRPEEVDEAQDVKGRLRRARQKPCDAFPLHFKAADTRIDGAPPRFGQPSVA